MPTHPCPCCGYLTLEEPPGSYEICPICFWEDDVSQLRFVRLGGGANRVSLTEAQANFAACGASEPRLRSNVRAPDPSDRRDPTWRPIGFDDNIEEPTPGVDYGGTYPADETTLYYWRPTFWRRDPAT